MSRELNYWLVKTEPESYSIHDLEREPLRTTCWDGVRNYQARNLLRDRMKLGDRVLFYHSNAKPPAVVGVATVVRESYPDPTAWDPANDHFDQQSSSDHPRWFMIDIRLDKIFARPLSLDELREIPGLQSMELLRRGSRLSVQPVTSAEFEIITKLSGRKLSGRKRR